MRTPQKLREELETLEQDLVRTLLPPLALEQFKQGDMGAVLLRPLAERLRQLATGYIERTPGSAAPEISAHDALAYALYYLPINFVKVMKLLATLALAAPRRVLDFGAGPGTASLAALHSFPTIQQLDCVEPNTGMGAVAKQLLETRAPTTCTSRVLAKLSVDKNHTYDLIICANVFNELEGSNTQIVLDLFERLHPDGTMLIIEPGTLESTHRLMALRDRIASRKDLSITFPCTHQAPCPMRATPNDWCHFELRWDRSRLIEQLDRTTGFNKHRLKFSALAVKRSAHLSGPPYRFRIVGESIKRPYGKDLPMCGPSLYGPMQCHKKLKRSTLTADSWGADWGDCLEFSEIPSGKGPTLYSTITCRPA